MDNNKKTIIFDFGNVLIDLDFETCFALFEATLEVDWSERKLPDFLKDAIYYYDKGMMDQATFIAAFKKLNEDASDRDIIRAWNSLIKEMPAQRFDFLENLAPHFNLVLLSNINELHLSSVHEYLSSKHNITNFEDRFFDSVFYSHHIGKRKPDDDIYEHVTQTLAVAPDSILFVDDLKENVTAAKAHKWKAVVHKPSDEISTIMPVYLKMAGFRNPGI
jgi:putative hydrolase of the HAD superfamily